METKMMLNFRFALSAVLVLAHALAFSAEYPDRAIKIIVPFAAGGITDVVSRVVAKEMSENLKQPVIVENKPGVGGSHGAKLLSGSAPDGYALGITTNGNMAANKFLYKDIGYDPEKDFTHLSILFAVPYMIIASENSGIKSIKQLIDRAKQPNERLSMANGGFGTAVHLMAESFSKEAGIQISHIPYKGEAPAVTDVLGGHTALGISSYSSIAQHISSGKIAVLAVTSKKRLSILPDVPTLSELGFDLPITEAWFGIAGPKGLDVAVVSKLHKAIATSLESEEVTKKVGSIGGRIIELDPAGSAKFVENEIPRWGQVIKQANIQPN
jgi:tripartite-type tricarboxylate transporter receptor subunit TctC